MVKGKHVKPVEKTSAARPGQRALKTIGYPLSFAALCALACGPGYALAAEAANNAAEASAGGAAVSDQASNAPVASKKDETVYVFARPDGSVKNVQVSDKLTNAGASPELADSSTLSNIENVEGDEAFRGSGAQMVWDAQGSDIYYRGDSDAEPPLALNVSYKLDGAAVSASELAGKSGKVEISYNFKNNSHAAGGVQVPFAAITGMLFDSDDFKDIEVDNGKVVDDGDRVVVVGYAMPGLADSLGIGSDTIDIPSGFTVKARVTDFALSSTLTMVTGNLFDSVNLDEFDTKGLSSASGSLKDAMSQLIDGAGQLADGAGQLAEGTVTMQDKASALPDGVQQLYDGSGALADGLSSVAEGTGSLASGASSVSSGADALASGARDLDSGLGQLSGGLDQLAAGADSLATGAASVSEGAAKLADSSTGIPAIVSAIGNMKEQGAAVPTDHAQIAALESTVSGALPEAYAASVNGLLEYAYGINGGISQLSAALDASGAEVGVQQLAAGAEQLSGGADELSAGLSTAASSAQAASAGASRLSSGAGSLSAGASQLAGGANQLNSNIPAVVSGSESLRDGLAALNSSAGSLIAGVKQLVDGTAQLASGTTSLKDGLVKFNDEGITKITDFLDSDIVRASGKFEAVRDAGENYVNFSGITEGTKGSVKFVIETDAIE